MKVSVKKLKQIIKEEMKKIGDISFESDVAKKAVVAMTPVDLKNLILQKGNEDLVGQIYIKTQATATGGEPT